jgi:HEPN domain-containing protein
MNNDNDFRGWLADAEAHLSRAEMNLEHQANPDARPVIVQYAQLAQECAAKVIVSYYYEPEWTHDPSKDLQNVIRTYGKKLEKRLGKTLLRELRQLAPAVKQYAPWHVWSTYGRHERGGPHLSPSEICTAEIVAELMPRARHAVALARHFAQFVT